jgi:threonyl-tRNA synthetase
MLDEHDHRYLGQRLDLFHFQEEAPGMVFWHPRGLLLYRVLESELRQQVRNLGYREVRTPQVLSQRVWESSGHWQSFREEMLVVNEGDRAFALKPVSCPGHIEIVRRMAPSYRDLPIRLAEFGLVHRNERSGSLHGLFRLRQFSQDDGHVFCSEDQIDGEIDRFYRSLCAFYAEFGFVDLDVSLSGRPEQSEGVDSLWEQAEKSLAAAALKSGIDFHLQPGQGAFYAPKLDFSLKDRLGRSWQCGTIQLDHVLPERFDIHYVGSGGDRRKPVILHRALFGSLERFIGILLEHYRGALPAWLAPEQVLLAPVSGADGYAENVLQQLSAANLRARIDCQPDSLARKVVGAHEHGIPFVVVVGSRERASGSVRIRERNGRQREVPLNAAIDELAVACSSPSSRRPALGVPPW